MTKTSISQYIKPKILHEILKRSSSMLEMPLSLQDMDGNEIAASGNGAFPLKVEHLKEFCPILVRGKVLGSVIGHETERFRGGRLKEVLEKVADNIMDLIISEIKLDSMSEELLHNYKVLNLFYNVSNSLVNILNVRKVCNVILDRIVGTIGLSRASVLLLNKKGDTLSVVAHKGLPGEEVENALFRLEESVCREAIEKAKPLFIQDIDNYPGLKKRSRGKYRSNSFISVPILKSGRLEERQVLGVINVTDKRSGETFFSGDMKLIIALTSLVSMSIQNAKYFEEVERSKEEWESTFDAITDSVAIIDTDYHLRKVNKAYDDSYGFKKDDLVNKVCYRVFYQKEGPCVGCPVTRTLLTSEPSYAEKTIVDKVFRQWTYPIFDELGRASSVVMYTRNVTNLKKLKERLTQSERMASIGQIAAGMAHEIRNPLGSIVTAVDVLSSGGGVKDENFSTLSDVLRVESRRLNHIISEFLLYAAPQKPRLKENLLNYQLEEVLRMIQPKAEQEKIALEVFMDREMKSTCFDADKIKQVIWNILLNGIEAMDPGGTLTISTKCIKDGIQLRIRDQGPGIRQEDQSKIFDPFYTTKVSGTGLGLSVVNRLVQDHQGEIEIQSRPGQGAEFIVTLPLATC